MSKRYSPNTPDMTQPNNTRARVRTEVASQREQYGTVSAVVRDKNGNIIQRQEQAVDSLVSNFWRLMYSIHSQESTNPSLPSLAGGNVQNAARTRNSDGDLESYVGIVVGSGTTAVAYADTGMATLITHGVGTGQLSAEDTSNYYDPITNAVEIVRTFVNADTDAADVTVREVGICNAVGAGSLPTTSVNLYCRDILGEPLVIPFEGVLTVVYTIQFTNGNANYTRLFNRNAFRPRNETTTYVNVVHTNGLGVNFNSDKLWGVLGGVGATTNGIVLGTSNTTPTNASTWAMEAPIAHGTSAGELFYYESTITSFETNTATNSCRWYLNRVVQNRSGGTIAVNEIGLFTNVELQTASTYRHFMVDRKFPDEGGVTIADGQFATFSWEFCYIL
jgi:hypothetical protein